MSVLVGISGGVDSTTALAWAKERGLAPIGCQLIMREGAQPVPNMEDRAHARECAELLGVPLIQEDVSAAFEERVIEPFARAYAKGLTPNPCSLCNRVLKVASLIAIAEREGADEVLTGHYAQTVLGEDGLWRIARGRDPKKDQSYFLASLSPEQVAKLHFPFAETEKSEVRALAARHGLPTATAKDSTGVCFAPDGDYRPIVGRLCPEALEPGPIVDGEGHELGKHRGVASITVGQRKGLGLSGGPWFVRRIDAAGARVIVDHGVAPRPRELRLEPFTANVPDEALGDLELTVMTHYRTRALPATIERTGSQSARVTFTGECPLSAPGQSAVLYAGSVVVGEGTIQPPVEEETP